MNAEQEILSRNLNKLTSPNFSTWKRNLYNTLSWRDLEDVITENPSGSPIEIVRKKKKATTLIRLHLAHKNLTQFVFDDEVFETKELWDSIDS